MATKLIKPVRREIEIDGEAYTVTVSPDGLRLARKRFRSGVGLSWRALIRTLEGMQHESGNRATSQSS